MQRGAPKPSVPVQLVMGITLDDLFERVNCPLRKLAKCFSVRRDIVSARIVYSQFGQRIMTSTSRLDPTAAASVISSGAGAVPARAILSLGRAKAALAVSDAASVFLSGLFTKILYLDLIAATGQPIVPYLLVSLLLTGLLLLFFEQMGLYSDDTIVSRLIGFGPVWGGLALSFLITLGLLYTFKLAEDFSRAWVFLWFACAAFALAYTRSRFHAWVRRNVKSGRFRRRVALVGTAEFVQDMAGHLATSSPLSEVRGTYLIAPKEGASVFDGRIADLQRELTKGRFDQVIVCIPPSERNSLITTTQQLGFYSGELLLCTDMSAYPVATSGVRSVGDIRMDVVNLVPPSERSQFVKLLLDCTLAAIGIVLLTPLFALVALAIKLDSPGPVLFVQRRYGRNNSIFGIFKFRTMHVQEDGAEVRQAQRDDVRITQVGRILRRTSIDELPQLFNVLLGHMSIVGPRPHAIAHDDAFEKELDLFARRKRVRPGITGWAQIHGYRGETPTTDLVRARMEHDLFYIENWSIWLDLEVIARTMFVVGRGAY